MCLSDHSKIEVLAETQYLRLIQDQHWTYVQRPNITGAIAIIGLTDACEIVLIDQYRIPMQGRVIELPAGLVGDLAENKNEAKEEAAQRELVEETGFRAASIRPIVEAASSAGLTDEKVQLMLATGLSRVGDGGGDHTEDIVVHTVPIDNVDDWLAGQIADGKDVDFKVYAGLYFAKQRARRM
jgi:ADP-ribose pyrophosphatase